MEPNSNLGAAPVGQSERIILLDSLRGIALLGILLMNIPFFGLPDPASFNPKPMHEVGTLNEQILFIVFWIFEGTQRAIFSMLFGAGILLFISRLEKRTEGMAPAEYFIRRQLWLIVFGLFNGYVLLWSGDILFGYGVIGIIVFAFRKLSPKNLLIAAFVCLALHTARENLDFFRDKSTISNGEAIARLDSTKVRLTEPQKEELAAMKDLREKSDSATMQKDMGRNLRQIRGNFPEIYANVSSQTIRVETIEVYYSIWDVLVFMLIGMAFFKLGILTGTAATRIYWLLFIVGLSFGLPIAYYWMKAWVDANYSDYEWTKKAGLQVYAISRTLRSLGFFGLIMLMYKSGWFKWLFALMRPVGQMAFTNYLMQSFLCGLFFYGIGFGMFGKLERYQIYYVVASVWVIEIIWSHIWLKYFQFGPLEWLWRSLTYWKRQPLKR
jgi:uncharacterized protein